MNFNWLGNDGDIYRSLIEQFETHYGKKIRWADEKTNS